MKRVPLLCLMLASIEALHAAGATGSVKVLSLPDFRTLAGGAQQVRLLPGQREFVLSMYGAPGDLESLRQLVGVMREQRIGHARPTPVPSKALPSSFCP